MGNHQLKIAISGASGFIGTYLSRYFYDKGHVVFPLTRKLLTNESSSELAGVLAQSNIVINLAGSSINHRWSESYKKELYDSRIKTTRKIVDTINDIKSKPKLLICASAVGYYPSQGCYDEMNTAQGDGFLSRLCEEWEKEAKAVSSDVRLVITRFGVVLAERGGAFEKIVRSAKFGVAGVIGSGEQYFSWIDIADLAQAMEHVINNNELNGIVNFVVPQQITNKELMQAAAKHYGSWLTLKIPGLVFRMLWGEAAVLMIEGQCVQPRKLIESGFVFKSVTISDFFKSLC